jgi:hypothetical protein
MAMRSVLEIKGQKLTLNRAVLEAELHLARSMELRSQRRSLLSKCHH